MTNLARTCALAVAVVAAVTAGCSSPADPPTARAKATTSTQNKAKTPAVPAKSTPVAGRLTYCAPLGVWNISAQKMPRERTAQALAMKQLAPRLEPVIAAARADGKTDVAALFSLIKIGFADSTKLTKQQETAAIDGLTKVAPVIFKDCGFKLGKQ